MILLRCLNCSSHWVVRHCSRRFYSLYCSASTVMVNKHFRKDISRQLPLMLQDRLGFSTTPLLLKKKKVKGWRDNIDKDSEISSHKGFACERGKDAVPHSVLVSKLQKCSSFSEQIGAFSSVLCLTVEDEEKRTAFCNWLDDVLKSYMTSYKLNSFGSSVSGLGFKGCDLDVCLITSSSEVDENITDANVPTPENVESGHVSRETIARLSPVHMNKFLQAVLEEHPDITDVQRVNGRCPVLKFYNSKHDIFCDLSFQNQFSLQNTALIKLLSKLDERFLIIARIVRYWAKYCGLVDGLDKFNSYALSILVLHFLQTRNPPVLPPVNEIISKSEYVQHGSIEDTNLLFEDLKKISPLSNSESIEELLQEFFFFYLSFDFDRVIVPATGCSVTKSDFLKGFDGKFEFNSISVQDPFKPDVNITVATQYPNARRFLHCLRLTCEAFESEAFRSESFRTPGYENLGLCSIFLKPSYISQKCKEFQENVVHTIEVPSIPNAASKVKEILEYGLLFHCISFKPNSNDSSHSNTLLKIRCRTFKKTWLGRDQVSEKIRAKNPISPLEKEHMISKEIAAKADMKSKAVLCEFDCECKESVINNEAKLTLHLNFKKPSPVALFLKEYIPCTLRVL